MFVFVVFVLLSLCPHTSALPKLQHVAACGMCLRCCHACTLALDFLVFWVLVASGQLVVRCVHSVRDSVFCPHSPQTGHQSSFGRLLFKTRVYKVALASNTSNILKALDAPWACALPLAIATHAFGILLVLATVDLQDL